MTENAPTSSASASYHTTQLNGAAPADNTTPLRSICAKLHNQVESFLAEDSKEETLRNAQNQCRHSLGIIRETLYRYPFPTLSLSYNGGKDCLVLLILYLSTLSDHPSLPAALPAIYIPPPDPFAAQDAFVALSSKTYHLDLSRHAHPSMKQAFNSYLSAPEGQQVTAIFVGTRRTDPHGGKLTAFDMTDHGWPRFMRVHPVLEWRYAEVWAFLRHLRVGYCELYDQGFTSLGGREDTKPNPVLAVEKGGVVVGYRPAFELVEDAEERLGRE